MGGASPYRAKFIGLPPCGQAGTGGDGVPGSEGGEKYFGLVNIANTCYVNSVLQALYFCTPFRKSAIRHLNEDREDEEGGGDSLLSCLAELFMQIESQKRTVGCLTPRRFLARVRKANDLFCTSEHQDAHEFMQFLLNDIAEYVKKQVVKQRDREREKLKGQQGLGGGSRPPALSFVGGVPVEEEQQDDEPRTWVHDIFQGYLVNQIKCLCCENVTARRETFLDLSVDIERHTSIAACLRAFESTELLRAGNKFFCDSCGCLQEAEKRLRIYQLPSVLTLHLKRFKYVDRLGRCLRLPYRVVFPLQLRVVEHQPKQKAAAAAAGGGGGGGAGGAATATPANSTDVEGSTKEESEASQPPSRLFELRSVVVHIGRESSRGHYVTVVRRGDRCVLLDDDEVRVVEPEVFRSFYGIANNGHGGGHGGAAAAGGGQTSRSTYKDERNQTQGSGWSNSDSEAGTRSRRQPNNSQQPMYERAAEGTCCGYLLFYEAVDGNQENDSSSGGSVIDIGATADWISEDRNLTDSDSDQSADERGPNGTIQEKLNPYACEDSEVTQAFEQRCIPRVVPARTQLAPQAAAIATGSSGTATGAAEANGSGGAAAGRLRGGQPPAAAGDRLPLGGSSAPAVGGRLGGGQQAAARSPTPSVETASPSGVNIVTMPSPTGSLQGAPGVEPSRG